MLRSPVPDARDWLAESPRAQIGRADDELRAGLRGVEGTWRPIYGEVRTVPAGAPEAARVRTLARGLGTSSEALLAASQATVGAATAA